MSFTKIPNYILESMGDMTPAEFKIVMLLCRMTHGFHSQQCSISVSKICTTTGMSRPTALKAINNESGGVVRFFKRDGFAWTVKNLDSNHKETLQADDSDYKETLHQASRNFIPTVKNLDGNRKETLYNKEETTKENIKKEETPTPSPEFLTDTPPTGHDQNGTLVPPHYQDFENANISLSENGESILGYVVATCASISKKRMPEARRLAHDLDGQGISSDVVFKAIAGANGYWKMQHFAGKKGEPIHLGNVEAVVTEQVKHDETMAKRREGINGKRQGALFYA